MQEFEPAYFLGRLVLWNDPTAIPGRLSVLAQPDRTNFDTLSRAFGAGHAALVEVKRVSDGVIVAAICAIGKDGDKFTITPFAVMVEGNPFDLFDPPNPEGGSYDQPEVKP